MPYVITVTTPNAGMPTFAAPDVTRTAVATLDEARERATSAVAEWSGRMPRTWPEPIAGIIGRAERLPEAGGTIGPLPDGTVIEVQMVGWLQLALDAGCGLSSEQPGPREQRAILAAFNVDPADYDEGAEFPRQID